jgi:hypothetical protein
MVVVIVAMVAATTTPRHFFKFRAMAITQKHKVLKIPMQA